ncbi:MAG: beta-N-acetylhexosaminidase [Oscillospiraceae bacterium]|nr:beta-N-acetylhexosaminidase [Oscillospiraceae bacterium]
MKKMRDFDHFGIMLPVAGRASMSMQSMKEFFRIISRMGYREVFLYTEDKMEVSGEPYHGYMRGRYSKAELRELDAFAASVGIELIPCVQTLAHLSGLSLWQTGAVGKDGYNMDAEDVLLVDDERTYTYIDNLFAACRECFRTDKIHIGMDEAHHLGLGRHLDAHGYETKISIMKRHLARVNGLAAKYGYENPMIWSDMLFYGWNNGVYVVPEQPVPEEYKNALPENVIPVFWDYYHDQEKDFGDMLRMHQQISQRTWFAGGIWNWTGFIPNNYYTVKSMLPALDACRNNGIRDVFMTFWCGGECSYFANLPSLFYLAEYARGNADEAAIKAKFEKMFGIGYDDFCRLDAVNFITDNWKTVTHPRNGADYMLYADPFRGFLDYTVRPGGGETFAAVGTQLAATAKKSRKYGYLFEMGAALCGVMELKYELGLKTRAAYQANDRTELARLAAEDYAQLPARIRAFRKAFEKQWMKENKPGGFEYWTVILGGLEERARHQRRRLLDYLAGKTNAIEELSWELLPYREKEQSWYYRSFLQSISLQAKHI